MYRVGIRATALRDRDRASIEVYASYAASLVLVSVSLLSIGQVTKVSEWTVLGRFYSHLAFCNYFWPVRYRVGIVGIRNLGYRRRDRELDTLPLAGMIIRKCLVSYRYGGIGIWAVILGRYLRDYCGTCVS